MKNNTKNITRLESYNGWQVRVTKNNITRSKFFSDNTYSTAGYALDSAIAYREYINSISLTRFIAPAVRPSIKPIFVKHMKPSTLYQGVVQYALDLQ